MTKKPMGLLTAALMAALLTGAEAHGATPTDPVRASRTTEITSGTALSTEVTVSRNGRIDGTYQLRRWAWLTGKCGFAVVTLRDSRGNVIHSSEVFRGCVNPRSSRGGSFQRRISAADAARVHRVEIVHRHYTSCNLLRRADDFLHGGGEK